MVVITRDMSKMKTSGRAGKSRRGERKKKGSSKKDKMRR